jgi:uncharacterized protein YjiK
MRVAASLPVVHLKVLNKSRLGVPEASGIAPLGGKRFVVVDDERGVFVARPGEKPRTILAPSKHRAARALEGVTLTPDRLQARVLSERGGKVFDVSLSGDPDPRKVGALPELGTARNRGWEGHALLPAHLAWDGSPHLVAVHQAKPRRIGIFSWDTLRTEAIFKLPSRVADVLDKLSDVAVHPRSGNLFVLSGRAHRIVEFKVTARSRVASNHLLDHAELSPLRVFDVPERRKDVPEALSFDDEGRLWVATDGRGRLYELRLPR